jgi:hypothetical protein
MNASETEGNEKKKFVFAPSLLDTPGETPLSVRERCRYVGRDTAL